MALTFFFLIAPAVLHAAPTAADPCPRPVSGSNLAEPADLRSKNGLLELTLTARNSRQPDGTTRYCYTDAGGRESPTLRLKPGDEVIIHLRNELQDLEPAAPHVHAAPPGKSRKLCTATDVMSLVSTNLHFHGLTIPPVCHQDDVLKTSDPARRCAIRISFPRSRKMSRPASTGITRIFTASASSRCWVEHPAR